MLRPGRVYLMYGTDHDILYLYIRNSALQDRSQQRPLRDAPIGPGPPARGCSYRRVLCARTAGVGVRGLRASGAGEGKRKAGPLLGGGVSEGARLNNNQIILRGVRSTYAKREVFHIGGLVIRARRGGMIGAWRGTRTLGWRPPIIYKAQRGLALRHRSGAKRRAG